MLATAYSTTSSLLLCLLLSQAKLPGSGTRVERSFTAYFELLSIHRLARLTEFFRYTFQSAY